MTQEKKCKDLVKQKYQERKEDIGNIYHNDEDPMFKLNEYSLSWDYVSPNTFNDQPDGYYRWQLSYGGPADEFRIYTDANKNIQSVEYWYLDWFDGASIELDDIKDYEVFEVIEWQLELDKFPYEHEEEVA